MRYRGALCSSCRTCKLLYDFARLHEFMVIYHVNQHEADRIGLLDSPRFPSMSVLVGAPKANTSQPGIVEGGAVYYCPWPAADSSPCRQIPFDTSSKCAPVQLHFHSAPLLRVRSGPSLHFFGLVCSPHVAY